MKRNIVSGILFGLGIGMMMVSLFVGIYAGQVWDRFSREMTFHVLLALPWWIGGFVSGMLFIGFSEGLRLLQDIRNKLVDIRNGLHESGAKEKPAQAEAERVSATEVPVAAERAALPKQSEQPSASGPSHRPSPPSGQERYAGGGRLFHGVRMSIGAMNHDGSLEISPEFMSFYEEDGTKIFEMDRGNIETLNLADHPPDQTHVVITCKDDQSQDVTILFYCKEDPEGSGRELYAMLRQPVREQTT